MRWGSIAIRAVIAAGLAALLLLIGSFVYVVKAKYAQNEYTMTVGLAFNAAMLVNAEETFTDDKRAVIAEYDGQRVVIEPENYRAVQSCLLRQAAMPPFGRVSRKGALHITLCGETDVYIQPDGDGEGFTAEWIGEERYVMHAAGGNHWQRLLKLCLTGSSKTPNLAL